VGQLSLDETDTQVKDVYYKKKHVLMSIRLFRSLKIQGVIRK
jgi:hypothetical protein